MNIKASGSKVVKRLLLHSQIDNNKTTEWVSESRNNAQFLDTHVIGKVLTLNIDYIAHAL